MLLGQAIPDQNQLTNGQIGHVCRQESIENKNDTTYELTVLNIMLSSDSLRPNIGTRSHNLFGYASLLSITASASKPVAFVFWTHLYHSGKLSASARRKTSSLQIYKNDGLLYSSNTAFTLA